MKKPILTVLTLILSLGTFAQVSFDPGYFMLQDGRKTNCLIRNPDRNNNPSGFQYKLAESEVIQNASTDSVVSFEILNTIHKYQRHSVTIERSLGDLNNLPAEKEIISKEEILFLRLLVDGQASLYGYYGRNGLKKFFFNVKPAPVEQLVHYLFQSGDNKMGENKSFRVQLAGKLVCNNIPKRDFENLEYEEKYLAALFSRYNKCVGSVSLDQTKKRGKGKYSITGKAGINSASLKMTQWLTFSQPVAGGGQVSTSRTYQSEFGQAISPFIAVELEYAFPSHRNKWALLFDPTFQYYKQESRVVIYNNNPSPSSPGGIGGGWVNLKVNYSHVALPVGIRHYFFLDGGSKLFLNGAFAYNILLNPSKAFQFEQSELYPSFDHKRVNMVPSFIFGGGYEIKRRFRVEAGYQFGKSMIDDQSLKTTFSKSFTIALGYKLK